MTGDQAAELAGRGWHVFPVQAGGKRPVVDRWEQRACADPDRIRRFWPGPRHNAGVACGPSGLVVIDLDCHGELPPDWRALPGMQDGRDVFAQLCEWAGETRLPVTTCVQTPSGGWHLYFAAPPDGPPIRNSAGLLGPGVDVRAAGGCVVGPGSVIGGQAYELLDDRTPAPLPAWLRRRLQPQPAPRPSSTGHGPANLRGLVDTVRNAQPGQRTGTLVWAAHRLRGEIIAGRASLRDGELLVRAAVEAGIRGGERYAGYQVGHVLRGAR